MARPTVAVVGAGVAGLVAARELALVGARAVVFEAGGDVGGRAHRHGEIAFTHRGRDWRFATEHGIHGIWRQYRNLRRVLADEGLIGRLVHAHDQELVMPVRGGGVRAYEFGARVRNSLLPDLLAFTQIFGADDFALQALFDGPHRYGRAALDLLHAFAFTAPDDIADYDARSVADYVERWPLLLQRMTGAITHSAFFREADEVSLAAYLTGLQAYFVSDKRDTAFDFCETDMAVDVLYPLRDRIVALGGEVRVDTRVTGLRFDPSGAPCAVLAQRAGKSRPGRVPVDGVVLAVDPPAMRTLKTDPSLAAAVPPGRVPEGVPSVVVRLFTTRPPADKRAVTGVLHGLGADNFFWLHRLQRPWFAWHLETGGGVLECHLYGDRAAAAMTDSDEAVAARARETLALGWPEVGDAVAHVAVQRNAPTHVAFGPGIMSEVPAVSGGAARLALCGDWIACGLPYLYLERATATGLLAARALADDLGLPAPPEPLPPYPASPGVRAVRRAAKGLRRRGWLPLRAGSGSV